MPIVIIISIITMITMIVKAIITTTHHYVNVTVPLFCDFTDSNLTQICFLLLSAAYYIKLSTT